MSSPILILTTAGSQTEAEAIAKALVTDQLAACVNVYPITSVYRWQGEVNQDAEWQLTIKTEAALFEAVAARVRSLHSYDLPELIAVPITAAEPQYAEWLRQQVRPQLSDLA